MGYDTSESEDWFKNWNKLRDAENDAFESLNDAIQNDASSEDYEARRAIYADILRKRGTLNEEYEKTRKREE